MRRRLAIVVREDDYMKSLIQSLAILFICSQALAETSVDLEPGQVTVACQTAVEGGECGLRWNLPKGSDYIAEWFQLNSLSWVDYRHLKNKDFKVDREAYIPGRLYRVKSCRGKSGCTVSNTVWVPVLVETLEEMPDEVVIQRPDGAYNTAAITKDTFMGGVGDPLAALAQYNLYLLEPLLLWMEARPELLDELPPMYRTSQGEPNRSQVAEVIELNVVEMFNARRQAILESLPVSQ